MEAALLRSSEDFVSEEYGPGSFDDINNLTDLLLETVQKYSDHVAVTSVYQSASIFPGISTPVEGQAYLTWTFSQLLTSSKRLASYLQDQGITAGTPISSILPNGLEWAIIFWAAVQLRCPFVPLHPKTASKAPEISYQLKKAEVSVLVVVDGQMASDLAASISDVVSGFSVRLIARHDTSILPTGWATLSSILESEPEQSERLSVSSTPEKRLSITASDVANTLSKWLTLSPREEKPKPEFPVPKPESGEGISMIFFTSGTTAHPKMCPQTSTNVVAAAMRLSKTRQLLPSHKLLQISPLSHAFGFIFACATWVSGASIVIPDPSFSAASVLDAIAETRVTHTAIVPTMAYALIAEHKGSYENYRRDLSSLFSIDVGATLVTKDLADAVKKDLGATNVFASYGTTETSWSIAHHSAIGQPEGELVQSVGKATLFLHVRICEPEDGTHTPLKRGEVGELHLGGYSVIKGYHGGVNASDFYLDVDASGRRCQWFKTGDQAMMNSEGSVFVLGRYKDLIIRAGVNISPAAIEEYLNKFGVLSLVVGYPDEIAGEVPIAVVKPLDGPGPSHESLIENTVRDLGIGLTPERILDLKRDLGLDNFPTTTTGKFQKSTLASAVKVFLDKETDDLRFASETDGSRPGTAVHFTETNSATGSGGNETPTEATLQRIWARLTGRSARDFSISSQVSEFADSLMIIKFSGVVKKELGKNISASEISQHDTIQAQGRLLDTRPQIQRSRSDANKRLGPPSANELVHIKSGNAVDYSQTIAAVDRHLAQFRLSWHDVEDMTPVPDWCSVALEQLRLQSWVTRQAFTTSMASCKQLVMALETVLAHHPLFRSFIVYHDSKPHFVFVRPSSRLYKKIIVTRHEVDTPEDVNKLELYDENMDYALPTGCLFRAMVVHVRSTGTAGLVYHAAHAAVDASSINLFNDDIALALAGGRVVPRASFKKYGDMYALYRESVKAKEDCEFHAKRLLGVGTQNLALWPPERVPQQFRGSYHGWWKDLDGRIRDPEERPRLNPIETPGIEGVNGMIQIPSMNQLRINLKVTAPVLLKAAMAVFNIRKTGADEAIWGILDAARTWPAVDGVREDDLDHATDIAGPTFEYMADRTKIDRKETVGAFLKRMQAAQTLLTTHAHAPTPLVKSALPSSDASMMSTLMRRQAFNWPPEMLSSDFGPQDKPSLHRSFIHVDADVGYVWSGALATPDTLFLNVSYDDAQVKIAEVREWCEEVLAAAEWLGNSENWGKEVEECGFGSANVRML